MRNKKLINISVFFTLSLFLLMPACSVTRSQVDPAAPINKNKIIQLLRWKIDEQIIEARIEEIVADPLDRADQRSQFVLVNVTSGKQLWIQKDGGLAFNLQKASFSIDAKDAVIVTWASGSGDIFELYKVDPVSAKNVLRERYKDSYFIFTSPLDGSTEIFLADTSDDNKLIVKKYGLTDGLFQNKGQMPYSDFAK